MFSLVITTHTISLQGEIVHELNLLELYRGKFVSKWSLHAGKTCDKALFSKEFSELNCVIHAAPQGVITELEFSILAGDLNTDYPYTGSNECKNLRYKQKNYHVHFKTSIESGKKKMYSNILSPNGSPPFQCGFESTIYLKNGPLHCKINARIPYLGKMILQFVFYIITGR
jgi:hypothetical protein